MDPHASSGSLRYNGGVPDPSATAWEDEPDDGVSEVPGRRESAVGRVAARPPRLIPALVGLLLGLAIAALNVWVVVGDLRLRLDGAAVVVTVSGCENGGRSRTCQGSYVLDGRQYDDRLLLGGEGAHVGQTVRALVNRSHPGDPSTTGVAAPIEATLLALGGLLLSVLSGRRALVAVRGGRRPRLARSRRALSSRARVWDGSDESLDDTNDLSDG
jgi:hypothetical protein